MKQITAVVLAHTGCRATVATAVVPIRTGECGDDAV
jgi:hypothetical protein